MLGVTDNERSGSNKAFLELIGREMESKVGENADRMWVGRSWSFMEAIGYAAAFVHDRANGVVEVNMPTLVAMLPLDRMIRLLYLGEWTQPDGSVVPVTEFLIADPEAAEAAFHPLRRHVENMPGYQEAFDLNQSVAQRAERMKALKTQHGYIVMGLLREKWN